MTQGRKSSAPSTLPSPARGSESRGIRGGDLCFGLKGILEIVLLVLGPCPGSPNSHLGLASLSLCGA